MNQILINLVAIIVLSVSNVVFSLRAYADTVSPAEIAQTTGRATVVIRAKLPGGTVSTGSGFLVDPSGVVVTNFHVVKGATEIQIRLISGDVYDVTGTRGIDTKRDITVLQISGFDLPVVKLGNSNKSKAGDRIVVIGTALGILQNTVTTGVISGIRQVEGFRVFQMDAAVSPGNSGGPVVNEQNEVIGVTVFKITEGESLNFAVPVNYARGLLQVRLTPGMSKLATSDEPESLFGKAAEQFPKRWKSFSSGRTKIATHQGDLLYFETVLSAEAKATGGKIAHRFRKEGDKWVGTVDATAPCVVNRGTVFERIKVCPYEGKSELTLVSPTRIEGWLIGPPPGVEIKCRSCKYPEVMKRDFVWIAE